MSINLENNTVDIGYNDTPWDTDFGSNYHCYIQYITIANIYCI